MDVQKAKDKAADKNHYANWDLVNQLAVDGSLTKTKLNELVNDAVNTYGVSLRHEIERLKAENQQLKEERREVIGVIVGTGSAQEKIMAIKSLLLPSPPQTN